MAQYTPIFNLYEPDSSDDFADFRTEFNNNMNIIDQNLGGGGSNLILDAKIYSTEEKQIGVWTDKKPLYQRTYIYTPPTTISSTTVIANLSSDIEVKDIHGVAINSQNDRVISISYSGNNFGTNFGTSASNDLQIEIYSDSWGTNYTFYATVQYTKTTDVAGSGGYEAYGFSPVIYSDVERVIGVWRDNKPLYQRTIYIPSLPNATEVSYPHNISNLDKVVEIFGVAYNSSNYSIPITFANPTSVAQVTAYTSPTDIYIGTGMDRTSFVGYITLRYTKTTDVAGSGDYNTYGVPTVHYDTNEQVIGTWLGKPLYEQAFLQTTFSANANVWYKTSIPKGSMKYLIDVFVVFENATTPSVHKGMSGGFVDDYLAINSFRTVGIDAGTTCYVVAQYTKSTD